MKLVTPKRCPFCGAALTSGTYYSADYICGSHIWIEREESVWVIKGHEGGCLEVVKGIGGVPVE
jgi:hypothetical protein